MEIIKSIRTWKPSGRKKSKDKVNGKSFPEVRTPSKSEFTGSVENCGPILIHQVPISPTFYAQLLCTQIPKAQKDSQVKQLFSLSGSACVKALGKHVYKIGPRPPSTATQLNIMSPLPVSNQEQRVPTIHRRTSTMQIRYLKCRLRHRHCRDKLGKQTNVLFLKKFEKPEKYNKGLGVERPLQNMEQLLFDDFIHVAW